MTSLRPSSLHLSGQGIDSSQVDRINFLEEYINENYLRDVSQDELYVGQLKGMVDALEDPYSEYLTKEEFDELMEDTSGKFYGIGVFISTNDGMITVVSPIKDSPAEKAGLISGDIILSVDGEDLDGNKADQASRLIRGEKGSTVLLKIMRTIDGKSETFEVEVVRDEIKIYTVDYQSIDPSIAYIGISQFNENTYDEFKDTIESLPDTTKGIILDLRSNPGGLLDSCVAVADELLGQGNIVYTKDGSGNIVEEYDSDSNHLDLPLVTLINGGSASASEIVAGALKDHNRTLLVGQQTYGKGVVQNLNRFSSGDGIKLTVSEYFTPSGSNIDQVGISPDVVVELDDPTIKIGPDNLKEDKQLEEAIVEINKLIE